MRIRQSRVVSWLVNFGYWGAIASLAAWSFHVWGAATAVNAVIGAFTAPALIIFAIITFVAPVVLVLSFTWDIWRRVRSQPFAWLVSLSFWGVVGYLLIWCCNVWGHEVVVGVAAAIVFVGCVLWGVWRIVRSARRNDTWDKNIYVSALIGCSGSLGGPLLIASSIALRSNSVIPDWLLMRSFSVGMLLMILGAIGFYAVGQEIERKNARDSFDPS